MADREPPKHLTLWKQPDRWLRPMEFLQYHTPSRKVGLTYEEENHWLCLMCQLCQELGQRLELAQLVINTACVYLRRMFLYTDLLRFNRIEPYLQVVAATAVFLAAKAEDEHRKLQHVVMMKNRLCGNHLINQRPIGNTLKEKEHYEVTIGLEDYKRIESFMLKLLGFDVTVEHPHIHVIKACQMINASEECAQAAYILATLVLQMTNMCLLYSPATIAGACIYVTFKWARLKMAPSHEGMEWYHYVDKSLTEEKLKSMAKMMMDTFAKYPDMVQRVRDPQKYQEERRRGRWFRLEHFLNRLADSEPVIPRNPSLPGPSHEGSSSHPGSSHSGSGSSGASSTVTRPTPEQQEDDQHARQGAAPQGSNHPTKKKLSLKDYHQRVEQRVPPLVQAETEPAPLFPMHPMDGKLGQSGPAKSSHSHQPYSHPSQPEKLPHPLLLLTKETNCLRDHSEHPQLPERPPVPPPQGLELQQVQDGLKSSETRAEPAPLFPMHPVDGKLGQFGPAKSNHSHQPDSDPSQPEKLPHPLLLPTKETSCLRDHSEHPQLPELPPVPPPQGLELQQVQDGLKSSETRAELGKGGEQQTSPAKIIDRGLFSSVPNNVQLNECKVLVQDPKDSHANNAEACRKRSFTQSMEEEVEGARNTQSKQGESASKYTKLSKEKGQYNHSGEMESSGSATPTKLPIKRNAGKLEVKNHEESSPTPPPIKSSSHEVMVHMSHGVDSPHSAIVSSPAEQEEGLKLGLAMPVGGSIRSHDKSSHLSKAAAATKGQEHEHRHKNGIHPQTGQSQHHSSRDRSGHRSSMPQMALPTLSGDGSQQGKYHSQPPLQSQYSGFTFSDHLITPDLNGGFGAPTPPTTGNMSRVNAHMQHLYAQSASFITPDLNGGFGAPIPPTTGNMSRVNAHMQHLYAQSAGQHGAMYPFHPGLMNNVGMYPSSHPPLPPPLPDNPPPPPPPPPQ